jgi:hypothetical protein
MRYKKMRSFQDARSLFRERRSRESAFFSERRERETASESKRK